MKKSTEHMLIAPAILTGIILLRKLFKAKQEVLKQDDKLQQDIEEFNAEHYETFDDDDEQQDIGRVKRRIYVEIEEAQRRGIPLGNKFDALTSINKADLKAIGEQFGWKQSSVSKASGKPYAEAYFGSLKRAYNAISGTAHVVKDDAGKTILTWRDPETAAEQEASRKRLEEIERDIAETRKRIRANRRKQIGIASREELEKHKQAQFNIIQSTNPMLDDIHTGIRSVEDILTLEETMIDRNLIVTEPDWGESDILNAIKTGIVTIYSSYPIDNGVFVTPSRMTAKDYAGGGKVYSKTVPINKVAWIYSDEGQYADVDTTTHTADVNMNSKGVGKADHFSVLKSKSKLKNLFRYYDEMLIAEKEYEAAVRYVLDKAGISIDDGSEEDVYRVLYNAGLSDENGNTDVYENTRHAREILLDFVISMLPNPEREIIMENRKNAVQMNKVLEIARKFADA